MKKWLVDVPVKLNIWIREDLQRKQFEIIKQARPSILFLQSDGGRNEKEWNSIKHNRSIFDNEIDWDCVVYKVYETQNKGLYAMSEKVKELIWSKVDRCIFLEDDDMPAISFFSFCSQLLEMYKDDTRIGGISGFNPVGVCNEVTSDYFFSGETNPWGRAYWKRTRDLLTDDLSYKNDPYICKLMKKELGKHIFKRAISCATLKTIDGHVPGNEFYFGLARATQNILFITPTKNLISNWGCSVDSVHSNAYKTLTKGEKSLFYSKVYEINSQIKHPKYVIRDRNFEVKVRKAFCINRPFVKMYRRTVKLIKLLRFQGLKGVRRKISSLRNNKHEK